MNGKDSAVSQPQDIKVGVIMNDLTTFLIQMEVQKVTYGTQGALVPSAVGSGD